MGEDGADDQSVVSLEAALQGLAQGGQLGAQPALGKLGQHLRVAGTADQGVQHRPPRGAEDVAGDAVELDARVLEGLVQAVGLAGALGDLRLAVAGQLAQRALRFGRHEAAAQQASLLQLGQPGGVADVGLAARHLLDVARVDQQQLEVILEDVPDRLPVDAGGLHGDLLDPVGAKPIAQPEQAGHGGDELGQVLLAPAPRRRQAHAGGHLGLVHVQAGDALKDGLHQALPSLRLAGRRPQGPPRQGESDGRAREGDSPVSRGRLPHQTRNGLDEHHRKSGVRGRRPIISYDRVCPRRGHRN